MKESLKTKRGITLIALIITIIILLILAMVTINILINQGIIGHANNAVRGYEVAEEKELISLAYQNYKMDQLKNSDAQLTVDGANGGNPIAKEDGTWYITFDKTKNNYELSENGTVAPAGERWVKDGDTIKKGDYTLKIGDYVAYDHTKDANGNTLTTEYTSYSVANASADKNDGRTSGYSSDQTFSVGNYTMGWRVLGVNAGKIQLITGDIVKPDDDDGHGYEIARGGYRYGIEELHAISEIYGRGKGAVSGRSVNVEDINKITGYDPSTQRYNEGEISEYGNKITFTYKNQTIEYNASNGLTGTLTSLTYFDEITGEKSNLQEGETKSIRNTFYTYLPSKCGISNTDVEYNLLFGKNYYLASKAVSYVKSNGMTIYIRSVRAIDVFSGLDINRFGSGRSGSPGIRPVVTLSSNAVITKDADHDGSTQDKACTLTVE